MEANKPRLVEWRRQNTVTKIERPTNIARARSLGYKAKEGFSLARVKVKKGKRKRPKPAMGRKPGHSGRFFTPGKSKQMIAEEKAARKFSNLEVLNSYYAGEDGVSKWYEVIMIDPDHPAIKSDKNKKWVCDKKGRAFRSLTSIGKKNKGLR
jgi:large subunit ribosomal protein L15e